MPLPSVEQFIGTNVTEQGFKDAQKQLVEYVGNEVPKKVDTDADFATKANKANTLAGYGIADAYTKAQVDSSITAVSGGHKAYQTLAAAQAAQASLPANTIVEVTNDPTDSNNGTYQWNGTTLTKSAYDPLTQAKSYTNNTLEATFNKLDIQYVNILHGVALQASRYVVYTNGSIEPNPEMSASDFCVVKPATEYKTSQPYTQQYAFFDVNKIYISGMTRPNDTTKTFTTPINAAYARFTVPNELIDTLVIAETESFEYVTSNEYKSKSLRVGVEQVFGLQSSFSDVMGLQDLNIIDVSKAIPNRYVVYTNGSIEPNPEMSASDFCVVKPATEYKTSQPYTQQYAFFDVNKIYISGMTRPNDTTKTFTTPINAAYARFTVPNELIDTLVIAESSVFPSEYKGYSVKIAKNIVTKSIGTGGESGGAVNYNEIWVSADTSDATAAFTGKNAIQLAINSVTDASPSNRYIIRVKKGLYKITKASEFIGYIGYPSMVEMKDYVDVVGQGEGNTIVWAELPYDDADIGLSVNGQAYPRNSYQTLYNYAKEAKIKDITFVGKNLRYTNHQDSPRGSDTFRNYKNVGFIFKGDKGSINSLGIGTWSGEETYVDGGRSITDSGYPIACHSNTDFKAPSVWSFKNHNFTSLKMKAGVLLQNCGSLIEDRFELIGCSFGGQSYEVLYVTAWLSAKTSKDYDSFDHANWKISGYGNEPFLFNNVVDGSSLRVRTDSVGVNSKVRFGVNSSAYPLLIKNNHTNSDASLYFDSREYIDGYIVQDGSVDYYGQAFGCKDLGASVRLYDDGINYTRLAVRLGDCSVNNKTLDVVVDEVVNTITFNKDYSAMTNAQILIEMNDQVSGATIDLINYGRDYFPMVTDVCETVYNTGNTYISKGSVVAKSGGSVRLANANDKIFGIALDDIPVQRVTTEGIKKGQGRVMKRGYIYADRSKAHFVLADNYNPAIGTRFNVINGKLVTDLNGKISADIDVGVISINC